MSPANIKSAPSSLSITSLLLILNFLFSSLVFSEPPRCTYTVGITQIIEHSAIDDLRKGILDALEKEGISPGKNLCLTYKNAQGNPATAGQIARHFVGFKPNLIIAITTPAAQTVATAIKGTSIPLVFAAVTDPVAAGLVKDIQSPEGMITGASDFPPMEAQLQLIRELLPPAKKLGFVFKAGDNAAATQRKKIHELASSLGFKVVEASVTQSSQVSSAIKSLVSKVDAIYVPLDNTFVAAMDLVTKIATSHKIPVFSSDEGSVKQGAVASVGYRYYESGQKAGQIAMRILKGEKPGTIPISYADKTQIFINIDSAKKLDLTIPKHILQKAQFFPEKKQGGQP